MKVSLMAIGKTDDDYIKKGFDIYSKRLSHYIQFDFKILADIKNVKNLSTEMQCEKEGILIINQISADDVVILLDEKGKEFSSIEFSKYIEKKMVSGIRNLIFVIGGPFGFSEKVVNHKNTIDKISLSKMTFSHQMVRLIFVEQLYRTFTILKGEPYHHQ